METTEPVMTNLECTQQICFRVLCSRTEPELVTSCQWFCFWPRRFRAVFMFHVAVVVDGVADPPLPTKRTQHP